MHRSKVLFTLASLSAITSLAHAQRSAIGQGSWIISGAASVNSQHESGGTDQTLTTVSLTPSALVFIRPHLAVGGSVSLGYFDSSLSSTTSLGIGPSVRCYFGDTAAKTLPFLSATYAPTWQSSDPKGTNTTSSTFRNDRLEGTVGLTQLVATHVGITGEAYYSHVSLTTDFGANHTTQSANVFGLRFGVTAFVY